MQTTTFVQSFQPSVYLDLHDTVHDACEEVVDPVVHGHDDG